jgi:hypothetical protein
MIPVSDPPRRTQRVAIILTILTGVIATVVAWLGSRDAPLSLPSAPPAAAPAWPVVMTIALPHEPPQLPPGPHQQATAVACSRCHSPQLILNQPPFPRQKWIEIVHKMVQVYGAPITAAEETTLVDYLVAIRGK